MTPPSWEEGGLRFSFSALDKDHHPHDPHIDVWRGGDRAEIALRRPVVVRENHGLSPNDLRKARRIVEGDFDAILRKWNKFFNQR